MTLHIRELYNFTWINKYFLVQIFSTRCYNVRREKMIDLVSFPLVKSFTSPSDSVQWSPVSAQPVHNTGDMSIISTTWQPRTCMLPSTYGKEERGKLYTLLNATHWWWAEEAKLVTFARSAGSPGTKMHYPIHINPAPAVRLGPLPIIRGVPLH